MAHPGFASVSFFVDQTMNALFSRERMGHFDSSHGPDHIKPAMLGDDLFF